MSRVTFLPLIQSIGAAGRPRRVKPIDSHGGSAGEYV